MSSSDREPLRAEATRVRGCVVAGARVFRDARGDFREVFNAAELPSCEVVPRKGGGGRRKKGGKAAFASVDREARGVLGAIGDVRQVSTSTSLPGVLRGLHASPHAKVVSCTRGRAFDVVVDLRPYSATFMQWDGAWVSAEGGEVVVVPAGCAHGFCTPGDGEGADMVYASAGVYAAAREVNVHPLDARLAVKWPDGADGYAMSEKDRSAPTMAEVRPRLADWAASLGVSREEDEAAAGASSGRRRDFECVGAPYLVMGASGFLGTEVARALAVSGRRFSTCSARLEDTAAVAAALDRLRPRYVVCAAGVAGSPESGGIDWCEEHRRETVAANVTGQLAVAEACAARGIHLTLFGSASVYDYDDEHPRGSGRGFSEADAPNFGGNFYARMRVALERALEAYDGVLNLRVALPFSSAWHPRNVLAKLLGFERVRSVPTSFTSVDHLFPLIPQLCERGTTGTLNFTMPGTLTNRRLLELFRQHVRKSLRWEDAGEDEAGVTAARRSHSELCVDRLLGLFPGLPTAEEAAEETVCRIVENGGWDEDDAAGDDEEEG